MNISIYPCDRGIPANVNGRGWHNFQANSNGHAVCTYCGAKPNIHK